MKVAIVVGHCQRSQGAHNPRYDQSEYNFNVALANQIHALLADHPTIRPEIVYRKLNPGIRGLVRKLNYLVRPKLIVSLHLNSFGNPQANGTEVLHWHRSKRSKEFAMIFERHLTGLLRTRDRSGAAHAKGVSEEDRGGYVLRYTKAWCVLCEPFFLSNPVEAKKGMESLDDGTLSQAYTDAIKESVRYLGAKR
ncbi:MAG: N-acetylmuramoyl-L-alanine amidase [Chlorobiales bacterium]|nr:N-acetylmuramoyl-L-alanine amidase [Chlorobiales bacterium]